MYSINSRTWDRISHFLNIYFSSKMAKIGRGICLLDVQYKESIIGVFS